MIDPDSRAKVISDLLKYFQTDTACFREPYPQNLVERQDLHWNPLVEWIEKEFGCKVNVTEGIEAIKQDEKTVETLRKVAEGMDPFELAGLFLECLPGFCG
jgi:ATP synthase F1 complex assembly factor 2